MSARLILALLALIAVVGCGRTGITGTSSPTEIPPATFRAIPSPAPTPTTLPTLPTPSAHGPTAGPPSPTSGPPTAPPPTLQPGGTPFEGCVNGWIAPQPGSAEHIEGLEILSGYLGVSDTWMVDEMRYFVGPDQPGIIEPRYENVERWYVRGSLESDPSFRGRFLLEKRTDTILGVSAVAPWESAGYESPDWTAFIGDGPPTTYRDLPGQWSGIPFDFVTGEGDGGMPGLPSQVVSCLAAT